MTQHEAGKDVDPIRHGHDSTTNSSSVKNAKLADVSGVVRDRYTTASRSSHHRLRLACGRDRFAG